MSSVEGLDGQGTLAGRALAPGCEQILLMLRRPMEHQGPHPERRIPLNDPERSDPDDQFGIPVVGVEMRFTRIGEEHSNHDSVKL